MTGTSNTNNTGVMHAVFKFGGRPLCGRRNAIMATEIAAFRQIECQCKRCAVKLAEMDKRADKAERVPAGTIDITPAWASVLPLYLAALCDGTPSAKQAAETELRRMALAAPRHAPNGTSKYMPHMGAKQRAKGLAREGKRRAALATADKALVRDAK